MNLADTRDPLQPALNLRRLLLVVIGLSLLAWIAVLVVFAAARFDVMVLDVADYWHNSQTLGTDLEAFHLPGYPAVIALFHALLPWVPPAALMQMIALAAWIGSLVFMVLILRALAVPWIWQGALAYGLFPFIGVFEVAWPRADALSALVLLGAVWGYLRQRRGILVLSLAAALLIHKALWPFVALMILVGLREKRLRWLDLLMVAAPLAAYWAYGLVRTRDPLWIVASNLSVEMASQSSLPVFDGLLGTLIHAAGPGDMVKFTALLFVFGLAVLLLFSRMWRQQPLFLALILPVLLYGIVLNQFEIWAMLRYGKFLVIPLWVALSQLSWRGSLLMNAGLVGAFLTQLVYAWYSAAYFFPGYPGG